MTDNTPREALDLAIGALADIAFSSDMSLEVARNKAKRIYEEACAALAAPVVEAGAPTTVDLNLWKHRILPQGTEQPSSLHWDEPERRDVSPQPVAPGRFEMSELDPNWNAAGTTRGAAVALASRALQAIMAAAPLQQPQEGWVSVGERLPEKFVEVLVAFKEMSLPSTGQYTANPNDHDGWCYPKENCDLMDGSWPTVTHWMPLPDHPHEEWFKGAAAPSQGEGDG